MFINERKERIKKLVAVFLSLSFLLSACGNGDKNTDDKTNSSSDTEVEGNEDMGNKEGKITFTLAKDLSRDEQKFFYKNPAKIAGIGDPFVIRDEKTGTYTMIATSASIGYYGWNSEDLVNWGPQHWAYQRPDDAWSIDSYWAPEVIFYKDTYYMFYTARQKNGRLTISVATADKAEGPYTDVSKEPLFEFGFAIIDASVFIDDDGQAYFYYTKDISENSINGMGLSQLYGVKLTEDLLHTDGEHVLLTTPEQNWETGSPSHRWNEGPIVLKHNDIYYLAYSANYFESPAYSVGYATSENPLGPYTKAEENPILSTRMLKDISGSGHHAYMYSPDGSELFTSYHTHTLPQKPSGNRQLNIDRVLFTEDNKMVINGPSVSWLPVPANSNYRALKPSDYSEIVANADNKDALIDELLVIHPEEKAGDVKLKIDELGKAEVTLKLNGKHIIEAVNFVAGSKHTSNIANTTLLINGEKVELGTFIADNPTNHTFAGSITASETEEVTFIFEAENKDNPVVLSEIYLIERKK